MDSTMMAAMAAFLVLAAGSAILYFVRRDLHARKLRIRLDFDTTARASSGSILGLSDPFTPVERSPSLEHPRAGARGIEPPTFWLTQRRAGRMAPALLVSTTFHVLVAAAAPEVWLWLSRALDREAILVVRVEGAIRMPITLHAPDLRKILFARGAAPEKPAPGRKGSAAAPRRRAGLVEPAIPNPSRRTQDLPAPPVDSAATAMEAPRPERAYRVVSATTLLQPRRPAAQKEIVELPAFALWSGRMPEVPLVQTPGSPLSGMARVPAPPRAPVLPLRSGVPVRAEPPRLEEPRLALPPPGIPAVTPPTAASFPGSGAAPPGEPVSVVSISPIPLQPGEAVAIPPVNQVGGGLAAGNQAVNGAGAFDGRQGTGPASGTASGQTPAAMGQQGGTARREGVAGGAAASAGGVTATAVAGLGRGPTPGSTSGGGLGAGGPAGRAVAGAGSGAGTGGATSSGSGPGGGRGSMEGRGSGAETMVPVRLGSQTVMMERRPGGAVVLHYPPDGSFDVIVVESGLPEVLEGLARRLSCRPVHTAYLNVGAEHEWMLHFCPAGQQPQVAPQAMVVTLEDPPPLKPPYVLRAELPAPEEWQSSQYQVFHGFINGQGKLERISALRAGRNPAGLLKLLPYWEFRAAARGGASVEIEVMLVVPPERAHQARLPGL